MKELEKLYIKHYGTSGSMVIVLHGGPAAIGSVTPIARELADSFRVIEPWQRGSGDEPLTVARHIEDLAEIVNTYCTNENPALVGESWGAMLALAYCAVHPDTISSVALVGCGTFDKASRNRFQGIIEERTSDEIRLQIERLSEEYPDPELRLIKRYELIQSLYNYELQIESQASEVEVQFDVQAHKETWADMILLQERYVYPSSFTTIKSPVLMLHGKYDPHPGDMIRDNLKQYIPHIKYHSLVRCGHSPWKEKYARDPFFRLLKEWLRNHTSEQDS